MTCEYGRPKCWHGSESIIFNEKLPVRQNPFDHWIQTLFFFCLGHLIFHINETHNLVNFQNYKCLVHKGRAKIPTSFKIWVPAPHSLYYFVCMILFGKIVLFPMSMYTKLPIDHSSHLNLYKEIGLQSFRVPPTIQEYTIPSIENASKTSKMLSEESLSKRPMKLRFNYLW